MINRRQQGDLGEASAIEWLSRQGATVSIPLGHSPDYDLIAELGGQLLRVQVKTSTCLYEGPSGIRRWSVNVCTNGGNRSWTGTVKLLDPTTVDYLFALVGDGRRWFIPADHIEASRALRLGGRKYSEFEIDHGQPITQIVYGDASEASKLGAPGECPSGQREHAVNVPAMPTQVRILSPPSPGTRRIERPKYERRPARNGQTILGAKRRLGIPVGPCSEAGLSIGDRMRVVADGPGRVVLERIEPEPQLPVSGASSPS